MVKLIVEGEDEKKESVRRTVCRRICDEYG